MIVNENFELAFEISQKQFVISRRQQFQNVIVIFLQMAEQMEKNRAFTLTFKNVSVVGITAVFGVKYVTKQFFAKLL